MITISGLNFSYPESNAKVLEDLHLEIEPGSRVVLTGLNGAGKSTLLSIIAGQKMAEPGVISVLGMDPFRDLKCFDNIRFITADWIEYVPSLVKDVTVRDLLDSVMESAPNHEFHSDRRLMQLLGVSPSWQVSVISEGQRRRVQLVLKLLRKGRIILLDEATTGAEPSAAPPHRARLTGSRCQTWTSSSDGTSSRCCWRRASGAAPPSSTARTSSTASTAGPPTSPA